MALLFAAGACKIEENPAWQATGTGTGTATDTSSGSGTGPGTTTSAGSTGTSGSTSGVGTGTSDSASSGSSSGVGTGGSTTGTATSSGTTGGAAPRTIFVTDTIRYGAFGGQAQADAVCQSQADGAALGGIWRALLSTPALDARDALDLQGPLLNMMGEVVANDDADLWDGSLGAAVSYDQNGNVGGTLVWTGTEPDGTASVDTCEGWTAPTGSVAGNAGDAQSATGTWTSTELFGCSKSAHFYCVSD